MPEVTHQNPVFVSSSQRRGAGLASQLALIIALLIIGGLLAMWRPWDATTGANARTVSVTGEAEITAEPDEYIFMPQYTFKNAKQAVALEAATAKTSEVVTQIKALGVADSKIKTDTNGQRTYYDDNLDTYYASLTVTINDKALAQKVQDYLLTTTPLGSVTPQANFSQAKQKQLTDQARDAATKDARAKADQSARNLGFTVGKVKEVKDDPNGIAIPFRVDEGAAKALDSASTANAPPIQAGENKLTYKVSVVYYIK